MGFIYDIGSKYQRKCAETLSKSILLRQTPSSPQKPPTGQLLKHVALIICRWPMLLKEWVANAFRIRRGQGF
jgi:hypothetical protein